MFLHIGKTHAGWTYSVSIQGNTRTLAKFCEELGLKYNSVTIAIRRRGLIAGMHQRPFVETIKSMQARRHRGTVKCPCCGKGRIAGVRSPRDSRFMKPVATLEWFEPDGSKPVWTVTKESVNAQDPTPGAGPTAETISAGPEAQ